MAFINVWNDNPGQWAKCTICGEEVQGFEGVVAHKCGIDKPIQSIPLGEDVEIDRLTMEHIATLVASCKKPCERLEGCTLPSGHGGHCAVPRMQSVLNKMREHTQQYMLETAQILNETNPIEFDSAKPTIEIEQTKYIKYDPSSLLPKVKVNTFENCWSDQMMKAGGDVGSRMAEAVERQILETAFPDTQADEPTVVRQPSQDQQRTQGGNPFDKDWTK